MKTKKTLMIMGLAFAGISIVLNIPLWLFRLGDCTIPLKGTVPMVAPDQTAFCEYLTPFAQNFGLSLFASIALGLGVIMILVSLIISVSLGKEN